MLQYILSSQLWFLCSSHYELCLAPWYNETHICLTTVVMLGFFCCDLLMLHFFLCDVHHCITITFELIIHKYVS